MTHQPDLPFGCSATWGRPVPLAFDGGLHVCNKPNGHDGPHECKCGLVAERDQP